MKGVLYIDGVDVFSSYGVSVSYAAYDDLVCLPELKPVPFNDWHEKNGIDPDLSAPVIAAKSVTIPLNVLGNHADYNGFIRSICDKAYHSFNFVPIGLTKRLRLVNSGELQSTGNLSSFSLTFSDDDPMDGYVYASPMSSIQPLGDYLLDGVDLASYGIRVLKGSLDSIRRNPDVKENLLRDVSVMQGNSYDGKIVTYKSKTAEIRCLMRARNAEEFWRNRNALLFNLTKPGERALSVTELSKRIPCYYKGCSVGCFFPDNGKYWFEFTLSLEFFKGVI